MGTRSNPNTVKRTTNSPQEAYVTWNSKNGHAKLSYKDENGQKQLFNLKKFQFMVLNDNLMTVGGYKDKGGTKITISSNIARCMSDDVLKVRRKINGDEKLIAEGPWRMIKSTVKDDFDGKYYRYIYAMLKVGSKHKLVVIKFKGLDLSQYFGFEKGKTLSEEDWVVVTDTKTISDYAEPAIVPIFGMEDATDKERMECNEMSAKVKEWHDEYFDVLEANNHDEEVQAVPEQEPQGEDEWPLAEDEPADILTEELPF